LVFPTTFCQAKHYSSELIQYNSLDDFLLIFLPTGHVVVIPTISWNNLTLATNTYMEIDKDQHKRSGRHKRSTENKGFLDDPNNLD
jgi:hypothetical protein